MVLVGLEGRHKRSQDPGSSYGSGFGHEGHVPLYFCQSCCERGVLSSAGTPNLAEWSWSCWWLILALYWKKSLSEHEAKKRRAGPRGAKPVF